MSELTNRDGSERTSRRDRIVYSQITLLTYNLLVLRGTVPLFWRCPVRAIRELYDDSVGAKHLEIGAGSGYFPARARYPVARPEITLVDRNTGPLDYAGRRLARWRPTRVRADVLKPLPLAEGNFDSVALSLVLHCLPGDIRTKGEVLGRAAEVVRPGGVVFGSTILTSGVPMSRPARLLNRALNARGVFHNERDDLDDLREQLDRRFAEHTLTVHGCVALYRARTPS